MMMMNMHIVPPGPPDLKLWKDFKAYHINNPHVWRYFKRFTREAIEAGHTHIGVGLIAERIRWETSVVTRSDDGLKINNNHRAFYARMYMLKYPQFEGLFGTRKQRQDLPHEEAMQFIDEFMD